MTDNQFHWARYKHRSNAARRVAYFLKNRDAITARQEAREVARIEDERDREQRAEILGKRRPITKSERQKACVALVREVKQNPCIDCQGYFHPDAMDFDHRVPELKSFNLSRANKQARDAVVEEISKCDVVCANCHRVRTARRRLGLPAVLPQPEYHI